MQKKKKYVVITIVVLFVILIGTAGFSYAKYASSNIWNYYLKSKGFYFTSDYLDSNNKQNINNTWDGNKVLFNIKNNLNDKVVADYDITYKVTCTVNSSNVDVNCNLNGTDKNTFTGTLSSYEACVNNKDDSKDVSSYDKETCETEGYNWQKMKAVKDIYFELTNSSNQDITDADITIKAESTGPYKKTITGNFILHKDQNIIGKLNMKLNKNTNYTNLVVTNSYNEDKCVKITWDPSKLLIDEEENIVNKATDTNGYINEIVFKLNAKNSINYKFYQIDPTKTYDVKEFTLTEESNC